MRQEHRHHIIPRHAGGTDHPDNIVWLTVEDHAIAHFVLWKLHGRWQDKIAWLGLSGRIGKEQMIRELARERMLVTEVPDEVRKKQGKTLKETWNNGNFNRDAEKHAKVCAENAPKRKVYGEGRVWNSMSEAAKTLGLANASTIQYRCRTRYKDWKYCDG